MLSDIRDLLEDAAATPTRDLDVEAAVNRSKSLSRLRISWIVVSAFVVVLAAAAGTAAVLVSNDGDGLQAAGLPSPPDSLRDQLPDQLDPWVRSGLVLVYREGEIYHLFSEGVMGHSCPAMTKDPEACFTTAQHVVWDDTESITSGHELSLPEPPENAEILWRGSPENGSIGDRSPGACSRIERFDDYYECRDGVLVLVREIKDQ